MTSRLLPPVLAGLLALGILAFYVGHHGPVMALLISYGIAWAVAGQLEKKGWALPWRWLVALPAGLVAFVGLLGW
ncbi:hypothetical protein E7T09_04010 [Deinococcus sp. KSM4-11]|uniref:hypothetical protein n=1 Tax=Deinococcus sp. KSM4-11 TaxID=2568654 RepID=UPI0010A32585|nr:hypothetical protein [Deinococcus sp. KSM4-11]THF88378.1 hypothetical protein E7T09_04010 [Deinococcus sp. KSM4-11]